MDGTTSATGHTSLMNDPSLYTGNSSLGFYLDSLSEITINSVDVSDYVVRAECNISSLPAFIYQNDSSIQEEVFPSDIFEINPMIPMGCDLDLIMGIENTILKDAMNKSPITTTARFYSDADSTYYTEWNLTNSSYYDESYISIPNPNDANERVHRIRLMCDPSSTIKTKDGITTLPTFQ
jgi:hypothetical protein